MSTLRIALILMPVGVVLFVIGAFGAGADVTVAMALSAIGAALLLVAFVLFLWNPRYATFRRPPKVVILPALIAGALHGYEHFYLDSGDAGIGWLMWPMLGYAILIFVGCIPLLSVPAGAAMAVLLAIDLLVHYDVFIAPKSSTAALALMFVPLWNILVFGPAAFLIAWLAQRSRQRKRNEP